MAEIQSHLLAARLLHRLTNWPFAGSDTLRWAVWANMMAGEYQETLLLHETLKEKYTLESSDHDNLGVILCRLDRNEEGMAAFDQALILDPNNIGALCNRGYLRILLEMPGKALQDLNKAVSLAPER